jgi:cell wall-associated NlpC family hydrolase
VALGVATMSTVVGLASTAVAVPPPPPNPSDQQLNAAKSAQSQAADQVGKITSEVSNNQQQVQNLQDTVQIKQELAMKALVDQQSAEQAATDADNAAQAAAAQVSVANNDMATAQQKLDNFASASMQQGSTVGSMSAFINSASPTDFLERASLLESVSSSQLNAVDQMQRARTNLVNVQSSAKLALLQAQQKKTAAQRAKQNADATQQAAVASFQSAQGQLKTLQDQQGQLQQALYSAQQNAGNLQAQRANYNNWLAEKQAEEAAAAKKAAEEAAAAAAAAAARKKAAQGSGSGGGSSNSGGGGYVSSGTGDVQTVINRALSVLGTTYAWGGGTASGPSRGIRDGGVADMYGDYNKIGFDCSGLMVYSFASAGIYLPHYSGYQYAAGTHVPLSQIQPGDMLFYGAASGVIHHVALYIGNGMMVEAPQSGMVVRVTSVRYNGDVMPYATRML